VAYPAIHYAAGGFAIGGLALSYLQKLLMRVIIGFWAWWLGFRLIKSITSHRQSATTSAGTGQIIAFTRQMRPISGILLLLLGFNYYFYRSGLAGPELLVKVIKTINKVSGCSTS
jgi:hypothetical protein